MLPGTRARIWTYSAGFLALWIAVSGGLAGCSPTTSGSRHTLYDSIDSLSADSSSIVVGTVAEQWAEGDVTISSITVTNAPSNPQLGANLDDRKDPAAVGDTVEVRQDVPPTLEVDQEYLLFLTPTMLPAEAGTQYFVTGSVAGLYVREGDEFRRVVADSGDTLADIIQAAETQANSAR